MKKTQNKISINMNRSWIIYNAALKTAVGRYICTDMADTGSSRSYIFKQQQNYRTVCTLG